MRPHRWRWVVALPVLLGALDLTVVTAVLPAIVEELAIPLPDGFRSAAWLVTGYLTAYAAAVALGGSATDRWGARRAFLWATTVFIVGSLFVAVGTGAPTKWTLSAIFRLTGGRPDPAMVSLWVLVGARCVQAIGAGAVVPAAMAVVSADPVRRVRNLGFIAGVDMAGWMLGHLYGGLVVQAFDWRMIFWLNIPLALFSIILISRWAPAAVGDGAFSWLGALGGASGIALVALAIMAPWGWALRLGIGVVGVGVSVLLMQHLVPGPLLRSEWRGSLANVLLGLLIFFVLAAVPLFVGTIMGVSTTRAALLTGLLLSAFTLPMAAAAPLGGILAARSVRLTVLVGAALAGSGLVLSRGWTDTVASMIPGLILTGVGLGALLALTADRLISRVPEARGRASGAVIILRLVGMSLGTALLTDWVLGRVRGLAGSTSEIRAGVQAIFDEAFLIAVVVAVLLGVVAWWGDSYDPSKDDSPHL